MASLLRLTIISLILFFGCHYEEVSAGGHKKGGYGRYPARDRFRRLKFTLIISGQKVCRVQELYWRLYSEMEHCDTGITVTARDMAHDESINTIFTGMNLAEPVTGIIPGDNATRPTAFDVSTRRFCAHRYMIARSSYLDNLITVFLNNRPSRAVRHVYITVRDVPPDVFPYIIQFLYTYQIEPNFEAERYIVDLYASAHLLGISELRDSVHDYMVNDMENPMRQLHRIIKWLRFAQLNNRRDLERHLIDLMKHVLELTNDFRWMEFGDMICRITRPNYVENLGTIERVRDLGDFNN